MNYYEVAPTVIARGGVDFFTYESADAILVGQIVEIPLGKKSVRGVVLAAVAQPTFDCKKIVCCIEKTPLPSELIDLARWMSVYYLTPLAVILQAFLPAGLTKKRRNLVEKDISKNIRDRTTIVLNDDQKKALQVIEKNPRQTHILHGVTGSGKTQIYIELVKKAFLRSESSIMLVPEIALTSQIIDEFSSHFGEHIVVFHSTLTESERHKIWRRVLGAKKPLVAIGARSALFLPFKKLGIIAIDECHEPSFKQDKNPKYSALRAASVLGKLHGATVIFGSATPLVTDYFLAKERGSIVTLENRARHDAIAPIVSLIDMKKRDHFKKHRFLSDKMLETIEQNIHQNTQSLIFHNRRGSASVTLCESCGWQALCDRCFVPMTLHIDTHNLRCHICDATKKIPSSCPECKNVHIIHKGFGTKLIELELKKLFPKARIMRFDGDSEKSETLEQSYEKLYRGEIDIIIGTQIVAKGLDLPHLRAVAIVQADAGLALPDFGARERTFQLLSQAIGRVGRSRHASTVIVQTYRPDDLAIRAGISQNYAAFFEGEIAERKRAKFPPFVYLLKLTCSYKTEAACIKNTQRIAKKLRGMLPKNCTLLGPTPAFYERTRDSYRWQLLIKSSTRAELILLLKEIPATHWHAELDPPSLL